MMFTKMMPVWKQYICTGYRISSNQYGEIDLNLAGTGQSNKFSGNLCRDTSSLIIKQIEDQNLGIILQSLLVNISEQTVSVSFVDDTDLMTNGENNEIKIQRILTIYMELFGATNRKVQTKKSTYFAWKQQ